MSLVLIVIIMVSILVGYITFSKFKDTIENNVLTQPEYNNPEAQNSTRAVLNATDTGLKNFDKGFALIIVCLTLALLVTAYFIDTHPIFFIISVIILAISLIVVAQFSNIMVSVFGSDSFKEYAVQFPIMLWINQKLPLIVMVIGLLTMFVMYAKARGEG